MTSLVGELMERAARALPALDEDCRHGWWRRHTDSSMWWAGAVLVHGPSAAGALDEGIDAAEEFYAARAAVPRFQVCPACPTGLDTALARRGYLRGPSVALLVGDGAKAADAPYPSSLSVRVTEDLDETWFGTWRAVHARHGDPAPELRLLRRVDRPSGYATVRAEGRAVAVGRVVADGGWAGLFAMATLPDARGRGAARATLAALAGWAAAQGVSRLYTQVMHQNTSARRVFERAGFSELASYHYRTRES